MPVDEPSIPPRNTEWATPFSPVAPVNAEADGVRFVRTYSAGRRTVAIVVTCAAALLVTSMVIGLATAVPEAGGLDSPDGGARAAFILYYRDVLVWLGICTAVVWGTWAWANKPVRPE